MTSARICCTTFAAIVIAGCSTGAKVAYMAANQETVIPSVDHAPGNLPEHIFYIENRSTEEIVVTAVTVLQCVNVRQPCNEQMPLNVRVLPGNRVPFYRVEPNDRSRPFTYRYSYRWLTQSRAAAATAALAKAGSVEAQEDLALQRTRNERLAQARAANTAPAVLDSSDLGTRIDSIMVNPDSVTMRVGETLPLSTLSISMRLAPGAELLPGEPGPRWRFRATGSVSYVRPLFRAVAPGEGIIEVSLAGEQQRGRATPLAPARIFVTVRP